MNWLPPFGEISSASALDDKKAFDSARDRHRIVQGSKYDWDGTGHCYGWKVGAVRALRKPLHIGGDKSLTGFKPRSFDVTFASSASTHQESHITPYYEIQVDAWCGMHSLNNFLGGPYCTRADCRSACSQVVEALSQAVGGDVEASAQHLDPETGWLSIDVINVLGAGQLGIHVEGGSMSLDAFLAQGDVDAFVNWNNQHWTVLVGRSCQGPWIHTNSVFEGQQTFHGRVETTDSAHVAQILADIASHCGAYSLHRVVRASPGGEQFLEAAGRRAMLPPEEEVLPDTPAATVSDHAEADDPERRGPQEVSVVTVNVDGMGDYVRSASDRMADILQEILRVSPQFILLQEVTMAMYAEIKTILADWQVYRRLGCWQPADLNGPTLFLEGGFAPLWAGFGGEHVLTHRSPSHLH